MKKLITLLISFLLLIVVACNNENNTENNNIINKTYDIDSLNEIKGKIKEVFYSLPSPIEMASIIQNSGVEFRPEILNKPENETQYLSSQSKALNIGIYGADLSFTSLYQENQYTLEYFVIVKKLAESLDIINAINDSVLNVVEENIGDNMALSKIISESFFKSDAHLKENNMDVNATLIVLGAWIESLYIAIELSDASIENTDLVKRIIDQRLILENILALIENLNNEQINKLSSDYLQLFEIFNHLINIEYKQVHDPYIDSMRTKTIITYNLSQEKYTELYYEKKYPWNINYFSSIKYFSIS